MRRKSNILLKSLILAVLVLDSAICALAQNWSANVDIPQGLVIFTFPDNGTSPLFPGDVYKNFEGYTLRNDSIKESLIQDMGSNTIEGVEPWGLSLFLKRQIPGNGFAPSNSSTPNLYRIIVQGYTCINKTTGPIKNARMRVRPCKLFRNNLFAIAMEDKSSYPSSHSCNAWGVSTLLASANPWHCDTIINRGFAHGQSRLIGGVHWQSDIDHGRFLATACFARLFACSDFLSDLENARIEVCEQLNKPEFPTFEELYANEDTLSLLTKCVPAPYTLTDPVGGSDMLQYVQKARACTDAERQAAIAQSDLSTGNVLRCFAPVLGDTLTIESHPATYHLLDMCLQMCRRMCGLTQGRYDRIRPFDYFNTDPMTHEDIDSLRSNSPYPSLHSAMGWVAALTLVMVRPDIQNDILHHGILYGDNRVSTGASWQSDVDMGRLVACISLVHTTSSSEFITAVRNAQAEFTTTTNSETYSYAKE